MDAKESDYGARLFVKHLAVRFALINIDLCTALRLMFSMSKALQVAIIQRTDIHSFHNVNAHMWPLQSCHCA